MIITIFLDLTIGISFIVIVLLIAILLYVILYHVYNMIFCAEKYSQSRRRGIFNPF